MRPSARAAIPLLALVPLLLSPCPLGAQRGGERVLDEVATRIADYGLDSLELSAVYERAARALVQSLDDPYAELFSPTDYRRFSRQKLGDAYGGVGIEVQHTPRGLLVARVFAGGPAEAAGVRGGDWVTAVDDRPTAGWRLAQIADALVGRPGTGVAVTVARPGRSDPVRFQITRATVTVPAVPFVLLLDSAVGYVPVRRVTESSGRELEGALRTLIDRGARAFVLDLRGNPGGSLDQSLRIANLFLDQGREIASVRYRGQPAERHNAERRPLVPAAPLVVLADAGSASAAEIVAGSLQDQDRALIVGTRTFGKGLVQTVFPLAGGWGLKLTTGRWYTPSGRSIQREAGTGSDPAPSYRSPAGRTIRGGGGITPDVVVENDTLEDGPRRVAQVLAGSPQGSSVLAEVASTLVADLPDDFAVPPHWRDTLVARWRAAGVPLDTAAARSGAEYIGQLLEQRLASMAFGDSSAFARARHADRPLARALDLLARGRSQQDLFVVSDRPSTAPLSESRDRQAARADSSISPGGG